MAYSPETIAKVRGSYVHERLDLKASAAKHNVHYATARTWKKKALDAGESWDNARAASRQAQGGIGDLSAELLEDLAILFQATIEEVRESEMTPMQKSEALSRMADSYSKTMKAAGGGNTKINRLAVGLETIKAFGQFVAEHFPEQLEPFVVILDQFDGRLTEVLSK